MISTNRVLAAHGCSPRLFREVCLLIHVLQGQIVPCFCEYVSLLWWWSGGVHAGCAEVSRRISAVSSALWLRKAEGGQM